MKDTLLAAFDRAKAVQLRMIEEFSQTALPVALISIVLSSDAPALAFHLSRMPTEDEKSCLPLQREGVAIGYYIAENRATRKLPPWNMP